MCIRWKLYSYRDYFRKKFGTSYRIIALAHTRWIGLWSFCRQRPAFFCLACDELNAGPHQNLFEELP
jgi:hypothetical protein